MSDLPKNWSETKITELCEKVRGVSYKKDEASKELKPHYVPLLRANNLDGDKLIFSDLVFVPPSRVSEEKMLKIGDIVVAMSSGSKSVVGKTAQLLEDWKGTFGAFCGVLRPTEQINQKFIGYYFRTKEYRNKISELSAGTNINNLKAEHFEQITIPIAPLNEQKRIVEKLEKLLGKVEAVQARLDKIPAILKRFRQAVLAAACSGKLTADWREKNQEEIKTVFESIGEIEIPTTWSWEKLPELGFLGRGKSKHRPRDAKHLYGGKYPFIQTGAVARSNGRITEHHQTYSEAGLAQSKLWEVGTVCITIAANIADSAILTYPVCFPDSVVGFVANPEKTLSEYIEFFIRTARNDLSQFAPATAQKNINLAILNEVLVPTPPLEEQKEIVRRVEDLFKFADQIESRYQKARNYTDKLTQSILAKAFRGELVPQDEHDEPADVLLERIKVQRNENSSDKSHKPKKKAVNQTNLFE